MGSVSNVFHSTNPGTPVSAGISAPAGHCGVRSFGQIFPGCTLLSSQMNVARFAPVVG